MVTTHILYYIILYYIILYYIILYYIISYIISHHIIYINVKSVHLFGTYYTCKSQRTVYRT